MITTKKEYKIKFFNQNNMAQTTKNLHLIETDKPSRLVLETTNNNLFITTTENFGTNIMKFQNIYITSDEEIKEGEYGILRESILSYHKMHKMWGMSQGKKIILTTDQELIADGVQAINEDFLQWFVHNPTCEKVSIKKMYLSKNNIWKEFLQSSELEVDTKVKQCICIDLHLYNLVFPI